MHNGYRVDCDTNNHLTSSSGLGNYDANVLIIALERLGYEVKWFDKRKSLYDVDYVQLFGFIVNIQRTRYYGLWSSRHWYAIKNMNYNSSVATIQSPSSSSQEQTTPETTQSFSYNSFDPEHKTPTAYTSPEQLIGYLSPMLDNGSTEILLVYEKKDGLIKYQ
ncbi:hypothetical protein SAMD00019534_015720 [Acytostelium subglobosum LB1]|uniref:hypothetical protein n=1 Tax=Acytostelium subglobosum LB1 TaxID=1410327 RepID=UPI000644BBAC|nr:hypothetical protein SAMD00019534_015720 [Acytostelium subglobosum LB1]GAM18397.1 hypothetical protein SAMD00019534_015720 [Acytostelium subglobosum LB1]|eukprot:XP_012757617.1 hypothetical protein SAMD00019534_015720 [Acytostelium subglobosum LB1]